jgi:hypothetical protein
MLMLEREIETSEGVRDEKVDKKREARRQQMEQEIVAPQGMGLNGAKLSDASDPNRNPNPFSTMRLRLRLRLRWQQLLNLAPFGTAFPESASSP